MKGFDFFDFLDWWRGLSPWVRYPIVTGIIAGGTYWFAHPIPGIPHSGRLIGIFIALGFILLFFGDSE